MTASPTFRIRRGTPRDAAALAALAARTFHETFVEHTAPDDMTRFLAATYGEAQQRRELEDDAIVTLVAEAEGALIGYAQLKSGGEVPNCVPEELPIELARFYVDRQWHGGGVAQALMNVVEQEARTAAARTLWLGVWERNHRAIAFYAKHGFRRIGAHPFLVGSDLQTDDLMARTLEG